MTDHIPLPAMLKMFRERIADAKIESFVLGVYTADGEMQIIAEDDPLQNLALVTEMQHAIVQRVLEASQTPVEASVH